MSIYISVFLVQGGGKVRPGPVRQSCMLTVTLMITVELHINLKCKLEKIHFFLRIFSGKAYWISWYEDEAAQIYIIFIFIKKRLSFNSELSGYLHCFCLIQFISTLGLKMFYFFVMWNFCESFWSWNILLLFFSSHDCKLNMIYFCVIAMLLWNIL